MDKGTRAGTKGGKGTYFHVILILGDTATLCRSP